MYEPADTVLLGSFQQNMRAIDIGIRELVRVAEAEIDMRLRGEVEDGVDLVFAQYPLDVGR